MATDNAALEITSEKVNSEFVPTYQPFFTLLTANEKKVARYDDRIGNVTLKSTNVIGDAEARAINAQDTERKHAKAGQTSKVFNRLIFGIKFISSGFIDNADFQKTADQILETNLKAYDKMVFTGLPASDGSLLNNGAWLSADPDFITEPAANIGATFGVNDLKSIFDEILDEAEAKMGNAPKVFVLVGEKIKRALGKLTSQDTSYARTILTAYNDLGRNVEFYSAPSNLIGGLTDANGILVMTATELTFNMMSVPHIDGQG